METTKEANRYEELCQKSSKVLGQLKSDIETLFKEINCDTTELMKQLGENGHITDGNVVQFFGGSGLPVFPCPMACTTRLHCVLMELVSLSCAVSPMGICGAQFPEHSGARPAA